MTDPTRREVEQPAMTENGHRSLRSFTKAAGVAAIEMKAVLL
jgi:hypothetical protein